jgi:hypothetical protein
MMMEHYSIGVIKNAQHMKQEDYCRARATGLEAKGKNVK